MTTTGGIEEDLIKCLAPTYRGDFSLPGALLRSQGLNRIGNLLVPNDNYCKFEDWIIPIFDQMLEEQREEVPSTNHILFRFSTNLVLVLSILVDKRILSNLLCFNLTENIVDSVQINCTSWKGDK